jgi:hypothetical protein
MGFTDTARWVPDPPPEFTGLNCKPVHATNVSCGLWKIDGNWYKTNSEHYALPVILDHRWNGKKNPYYYILSRRKENIYNYKFVSCKEISIN